MKTYRGSPAAARDYVEADRGRADDYYLAEGMGVAERYVASLDAAVRRLAPLSGEGYEAWVAGFDPDTGVPKGRLRSDDKAVRFVEVTVNGPKSWSLAAELHAAISAAHDPAQDRAATQIIGWLASHSTTRVGPRGGQVQVPVTEIEAVTVRHYTSRAGDPHRHLHLRINARVFAEDAWRGLHTVGVRDSLDAINGIGHAAVATDPAFREALAVHGFTLDEAGEVVELRGFVGPFSARAAQIGRNIERYEGEWRDANPGREPDHAQLTRKGDADWFLATVESAKITGSLADPALARLTVGEWSIRWLDNQTHLKPSTRERYAGILREHVQPKWGRMRLSDVSHADVQAWVTALSKSRSPATVRKVHRVLSLILTMAVKDGQLARNVATGVNLPRVVKAERQYLTHEDVESLAQACATFGQEIIRKHLRVTERRRDDYRLIVLFLAYTGVRFGELAALRVGRLDFLRRRAVIAESVTLWCAPSSYSGRPRVTSAARSRYRCSCSTSSRSTLRGRSPVISCSAARDPAERCGARSSAMPPLMLPQLWSENLVCTRTSYGTPRRRWPLPPGLM